jgi:hypothetical protein
MHRWGKEKQQLANLCSNHYTLEWIIKKQNHRFSNKPAPILLQQEGPNATLANKARGNVNLTIIIHQSSKLSV